MARLRFLCVLSLGILGLSACKSRCRELSEKLCACSVNSVAKEDCIRRASNEEARVNPSADAQQVCASLIAGCDCHTLSTPEGKRACGLSR